MFSSYYGHLRPSVSSLFKKRCSLRFSSHKGAYEGEGKTTVTILNKEYRGGLLVNSMSLVGFTLNIGVKIVGPMILFPKTVLGWNLTSAQDIHENSLALFKIIDPRPDIVVLGLDQAYPRDEPFIQIFKETIKKWGMSYEVLPVHQACHTFNFLNEESRYVVGLFLPPKEIQDIDYVLIRERSVHQVLSEPHGSPFFDSSDKKKLLE